MNKKGFLLGEETVKIILAIIAIMFLILFIVYLYNNYSQNKDLENAKSSLKHLTDEIKAGAAQVNIFNPGGWILSTFSTSDPVIIAGSEIVPKQCTNNKWDNCICLCISPGGSIKTTQVACDTSGTCQQTDYSVTGEASFVLTWKTKSIPISNPPLLLTIDQQNKLIQKSI
jgi:hypothetical protein